MAVSHLVRTSFHHCSISCSIALQDLRSKQRIVASVHPRVSTSGNANNSDGHYAALRFIETVRKRGATWEDIQEIAPFYQQAHVEFLAKVDDDEKKMLKDMMELTADKMELTADKMKLIEELRSIERQLGQELSQSMDNLVAMKQEAAEQWRTTAQMVQILEEQCLNLGLRLVVEAMMTNFLRTHLDGQCSDPVCTSFLTTLENQNVIRKRRKIFVHKVKTPMTPTPTPTTKPQPQPKQTPGQAYTLLTPEWSRPDVIRHFAQCPKAKMRTSYKHEAGNTIVKMAKADLQLDLEQHAQVVWGDLQPPHHILDTSGDAPYPKLPYGPHSNRTDTLFYLSAADAAMMDMRLIPENASLATDTAVAIRALADKILS